MYSTAVFYYIQRQVVSLLTGNSPRRYMPVYAKPLTLHKGVDNQIQFQFLNQDQKPVDITDKSITCRILNYQGNEVLIIKALDLILPLTGIAVLTLNPSDLENIDPQKCYYTLEIPVGDFDFPVFVDSNAGARGEMNIVNSILPSFVPSMEVSIPTGQPFPNLQIGNDYSYDYLPGNTQTYYSSTLETNDNPVLTFSVEYNNFSGNVAILGSTIVDNDFYVVDLVETNAANLTATKGYVVKGFHPYVRLQFVSDYGEVGNIYAR